MARDWLNRPHWPRKGLGAEELALRQSSAVGGGGSARGACKVSNPAWIMPGCAEPRCIKEKINKYGMFYKKCAKKKERNDIEQHFWTEYCGQIVEAGEKLIF